jgi:hypothetical protein
MGMIDQLINSDLKYGIVSHRPTQTDTDKKGLKAESEKKAMDERI